MRRRRRTELLLVSGEVRGTDHLGVVRAVNGKQLVQQVGHLQGNVIYFRLQTDFRLNFQSSINYIRNERCPEKLC